MLVPILILVIEAIAGSLTGLIKVEGSALLRTRPSASLAPSWAPSFSDSWASPSLA
jgi:hypothetical protein